MKSRQVGFVLMALVAVGIAALVFRIVSTESEAVILEGLLQVSEQASDRILVEGGDSYTELQRYGDSEQAAWFVDDQPVFQPIMQQFWLAVSDIYDAQLVSNNPNNHARIGVADGDSIAVSFFQDRGALQEKFFIGEWKRDVRLCYVRRAGQDETYGIPCPYGNVFDPNPDNWKNPLITSVQLTEIAEIQYTYPDEAFVLRPSEDGLEWNVFTEAAPEGAAVNPAALNAIIGSLRGVVASGFADDDESEELNFTAPDATVRVITREGAPTPSTRLRFLVRDDLTMYVKTPTASTVYVVDNRVTSSLLLRLGDVMDSLADGG